jgi:hypothetical protein
VPTPRYLERPEATPDEADNAVELPYGMNAIGIVAAVNELYSYLHAINSASVEYGFGRLEDIMQPAAFSGLISELMVRSFAKELSTGVPGLTRNLYHNGRPDLVPRALYPGDSVQNGDEGVEVKASRYPSSIQGHNAEEGWLAVIEFACDNSSEPVYERLPTVVNRVRIARLEREDWTFSGRTATSRRTPTANINRSGREKLDRGIAYARHHKAPDRTES